MIDPDGIQVQEFNLPDTINVGKVPEFDMELYNLDDDKDYKKFIQDTERIIRRSFEYRQFIKYLRENFGMNKCAFLRDVSNEEGFDIKIEIHHYPFSLHDIVEIVLRKRIYYKEYISTAMVGKECMMLHYRLLVGLIPLSETVHELAHSSRLFIPSDKVFGRYNLFIDYYKPFCEPEQLDTIERIEKYSKEHTSNILDTTILDQNNVRYDIKDEEYTLPNFDNVNVAMLEQIENIKSNNYMLPNKEELRIIKEEKNKPVCPISFF